MNFNPLPPHGGRHIIQTIFFRIGHFNPLPPHGGRRLSALRAMPMRLFQSTPSAWRETSLQLRRCDSQSISIHSLRMEGDPSNYCNLIRSTHFNPLPPHGGRQVSSLGGATVKVFQSTPSAWRETNKIIPIEEVIEISIHSLRMEGDTLSPVIPLIPPHFNPLPPHGGRPYPNCSLDFSFHISIHSLRMEGDTLVFFTVEK